MIGSCKEAVYTEVSMFAQLRKKWWLIVLAVVILGGAFWYWRSRVAAQNKPVKTTQAQMKDIQKTLSFSGRVDAKQRASMYFAGTGKIVYVGVQEGEPVKKWQTIASIDRRAAQKNLEKQLSLYQTQRWGYENNEDTRENRTLSEREQRTADQDQFALNRSVLDVELQSIAIEDTRLTSPINGILVSSPVKVTGQVVGMTDKFEVVDPSSLYFRLLVDEVDIDEIKVGQQVDVRMDAQPDKPLRAIVDKIAFQAVDSATGTVFPVELKFVDSVSITEQRVGMNGDADIVLAESKNVVVLPVSTVTMRDDKHFVKIKKADGTIEEREVQVGIETDNETEIVSGITLEDQVVLP